MPPSSRALQCAALLADAAPAVVDVLRENARGRAGGDLTVGQLRALSFLSRHPDASLSDVASVVGLTLPATSRLVDALVERKLVRRAGDLADRRKLTLAPTAAGLALLRAARSASHDALASLLDGFPAADLEATARVLAALQQRLPGGAAEVSA